MVDLNDIIGKLPETTEELNIDENNIDIIKRGCREIPNLIP